MRGEGRGCICTWFWLEFGWLGRLAGWEWLAVQANEGCMLSIWADLVGIGRSQLNVPGQNSMEDGGRGSRIYCSGYGHAGTMQNDQTLDLMAGVVA